MMTRSLAGATSLPALPKVWFQGLAVASAGAVRNDADNNTARTRLRMELSINGSGDSKRSGEP
jgi:hypothetical protein